MGESQVTSTVTLEDGTKIDSANLQTISLGRLEARDPEAVQQLLKAAQSPGFFYVDFRDSEIGKSLIKDLPEVYALSEKYFDQPAEAKEKDVRTDQSPSQDRGFKTSYCDETFEMAYEELVEGNLSLPKAFGDRRETLKKFSEVCHAAALTMVLSLSSALGTNSLEQHHRKYEPSDSGLKLIYEPSLARLADVGDNKHTDSGTLTVLFYELWGLHIKIPEQEQPRWAFTAPQNGCALINVADSLARLSGGRLHSPTHRVTQPSDGFAKRYYLSYFLRPEQALKAAWAAAS